MHLENHIMTSHPTGFIMTKLITGQSYLLRRSAPLILLAYKPNTKAIISPSTAILVAAACSDQND